MSIFRRLVWAFECDHPGCRAIENFDGEIDMTYAVNLVRKAGWVTVDEKLYCGLHTTAAYTMI